MSSQNSGPASDFWAYPVNFTFAAARSGLAVRHPSDVPDVLPRPIGLPIRLRRVYFLITFSIWTLPRRTAS